jgi:pimeloyl-ACP methyl ester carboxylesterase
VRRGWKILIVVVVVLAALLAVNTIVVGNETKEAEVTIEGGQILRLPGGEVQVVEQGTEHAGPAIVLIHCYSCSMHWWDRPAAILAKDHRVIRIDLLGHGGSQKPKSGYAIEDQAALVAGALGELEVQGAVVVGHSMGFPVAVALADRASQLVDRLVNIDSGPTPESCDLPFIAKLEYTPVLGQAMWRLSPDFAIKDGYARAFAPNFGLEDGFKTNPDQVVDDYRAMTYTSFKESHDAVDDYIEETPLDDRIRRISVPLLSIFGTEDQICDPQASQAIYQSIPGAQIVNVNDAGHSPNVEKPLDTSALITQFAADAGDDTIARPPRDVGRKPERKPRDEKPQPKPERKRNKGDKG